MRFLVLSWLLVVSCLGFAQDSPTVAAGDTAAGGGEKLIAVTIDDLPLGGPQFDVERQRVMTERLLASLQRHGIRSVGFVNETKLFVIGEMDERTALLRLWLEAGQELGNHTFSHPSLARTPLAAYQEDVMRGETVTRLLMRSAGLELRYFRHPFLRTGADKATRDAFESWLTDRGYTIAPVTMENSDYIFSAIYTRAKSRGDQVAMAQAKRDYLDFSKQAFTFFEETSQKMFGRQVAHTLLLHVNELNAAVMDDLVAWFKDRGYRFVTLAEALKDPAYQLPDTYAGPAGVNWLFRWDRAGKRVINWREEPNPSEAVMARFRNGQ